jgi:hypothetical protein
MIAPKKIWNLKVGVTSSLLFLILVPFYGSTAAAGRKARIMTWLTKFRPAELE